MLRTIAVTTIALLLSPLPLRADDPLTVTTRFMF